MNRMANIRVTTLPSGLRVASDAMDTVETAAVGAWVNVGARHEKASVNGVELRPTGGVSLSGSGEFSTALKNAKGYGVSFGISAQASVATTEFPPGRFSTTIVWPKRGWISSKALRRMMSTPEPGGCGR